MIGRSRPPNLMNAGAQAPWVPAICDLWRSVVRSRERPLHALAVICGQLLRPDLVSQLVDRAGKAERQFVAVVYARAGIHSNVEGFIKRHEEWNRVLHLLLRQHFAVDRQHAGTALTKAWPVVFEIEDDAVLARFERLAQPVLGSDATLPTGALQVQQVIDEHWLALEQVKAIATEPSTHCGDYALSAGCRNRDFGSDGVIPVQETWSVANRNAHVLAHVDELR